MSNKITNMKENKTEAVVISKGSFKSQLKFRYLLIAVLVLLVIAGLLMYYLTNKKPKLSALQQQVVENRIGTDQNYIQQNKQANAPNSVTSMSYANLAQDEAQANDCSDAKTNLAKAESLAPSSYESNIQSYVQSINSYCK